MKIETEEKYYCIDPKKLILLAEQLKFRKIDEEKEVDEYFTDIDSNFIRNRTCLRIRKTNDDKMEVTYKGKSDSVLGLFCKVENNISAKIENYDNYISLFSSLGYYSYVIVEKNRLVYELKSKKYKYSIMLDTLPEIGGFVEFEIISDKDKSTKDELSQELCKFVNNFSELNLKAANEPYRDIVAKHILKKAVSKKNIRNICINLDSELLQYEKEFFKKYKNKICDICSSKVNWTEYKKNEKLNKKIEPLIKEYVNNLIFNGNDLLVTITLLNKLKYKKYFFTKVNESFCSCFLNRLNIKDENILFMNSNDNIMSILKKNKIELNESIIINNKNFKENNSLMLVMINEK